MMKYDLWQYSDDHNCWDLVREWLIDHGVSESMVPKYGILPTDKRSMTKAHDCLKEHFVQTEPKNGAIACQYRGRLLYHVGIVDRGKVLHAHRKCGVRRDTIAHFERMTGDTKYWIAKCLL